jgi:hypothetical protein
MSDVLFAFSSCADPISSPETGIAHQWRCAAPCARLTLGNVDIVGRSQITMPFC